MDALRLEAIFNVLVEIRDRLPEKAATEKPTSVTEVMTDAIRLEKVRELAERWLGSSDPDVKYRGGELLAALGWGE